MCFRGMPALLQELGLFPEPLVFALHKLRHVPRHADRAAAAGRAREECASLLYKCLGLWPRQTSQEAYVRQTPAPRPFFRLDIPPGL